ncbi:unnamed protein product, partial [Rotaria sordida]
IITAVTTTTTTTTTTAASTTTAATTTEAASTTTTITTTTTSFPRITFTTPTLNFLNETRLYLLFVLGSGARVVDTPLPMPINQTEIEKVLLRALNEMYNKTNLTVVPHYYISDIIIEYLVVLNISLNATQRLKIVNEFFNPNVSRNDSYKLIVRMVINDVTGKIENFTEAQRLCKECELLGHGDCDTTSDTCICYPNFEGEFCRTDVTTSTISTTSTTSQPPSSSTNWTVIVAVISAIAGLLLIISLSMCIYIIKKRADSKAKKIKQLTESKQPTIPGAHLPTIGAISQGTIGSTDSSRAENEKQTNDASDTYSSTSTTTYNPTYHTNEDPQHTSLPSGPIPQ